jgi:hypothetical protein
MSTSEKITLPILAVLVITGLSGCYFGANDWGARIEKDFHLTCWDEHCKIAVSKEDDPDFFKEALVEQSVFAMGHNSDFIIAKQHPHKDTEIAGRLFHKSNSALSGKTYYELKNANDTIYLIANDSVFCRQGTWFHTKDSWTDPDSLRPYKKITLYHIIDLRWYEDGYRIYTFDNEKDFNNKRFILSVPRDLGYSYYAKTLE